MKGEMPRTQARIHFDKGWIVRSKRSFCRIDSIAHDFIQTKLRNKDKPVIGGDNGFVSMRPALAALIHAGAAMLRERYDIAQGAAGLHPVRRHAAAAVICDEQHAIGLIECKVASHRAVSRNFIYRL